MHHLLKTNLRTSQSAQVQRELHAEMTLFAKWKVQIMALFLIATEWKRKEATCPKMKVKLELQFLSQRIPSDHSRPMGLLVWTGSLPQK